MFRVNGNITGVYQQTPNLKPSFEWMAKEKEHTWCNVSCSGSVWSWAMASSLGRTVWHCTNKNRFNLFEHCTNQKQVQPVQQIEIVCVINTGIIRPLMIALQVSHSLQFPWTMSRSPVKINVNQFSPVTDLVPFSFSSPVVFLVLFPVLYWMYQWCSCPTGVRHFQNKLNLFWFGGGYQR